jgi:hypothetical protein
MFLSQELLKRDVEIQQLKDQMELMRS